MIIGRFRMEPRFGEAVPRHTADYASAKGYMNGPGVVLFGAI